MSTQLAHTQAILASTQATLSQVSPRSERTLISITLYNSDNNKEINTIKYIIEGGDNYSRILSSILDLIKEKYKYSYCTVSIEDSYIEDSYNSDNSGKIIPQQYIWLLQNSGWNTYKYPIITVTVNSDKTSIKCEKCGITLVSYGSDIETANCKHYIAKTILTRNDKERIRTLIQVAMDKRTVINDVKGNTVIVVSTNDIDYYSSCTYDYDIDDDF